jgi:hypothetical protein
MIILRIIDFVKGFAKYILSNDTNLSAKSKKELPNLRTFRKLLAAVRIANN